MSVELSIYFYYGGAGQRNALVETINYDLKRGQFIKFPDLFRPGADCMKLLTAYAQRDLKRQYKDEKWMTDDWSSYTLRM